MDAKIVAKYLTSLKEKSGLTYEAIAEKCGMSETTIRNLFTGKTEDPRLNTVAPITYVLNGSVDEMYTGKSKDEVKEFSINSIKEMYEFQLSNIRSHYEQHVADLKENHKRELALQKELTKEKASHANFFKIIACLGFAILIGILIAEVMNPNLGWIQY